MGNSIIPSFKDLSGAKHTELGNSDGSGWPEREVFSEPQKPEPKTI